MAGLETATGIGTASATPPRADGSTCSASLVMHLEPWWKRALLALAIVFCLVPLWRVSDSMPGQLLIVVGAAMVLFMVSELWRWRERR